MKNRRAEPRGRMEEAHSKEGEAVARAGEAQLPRAGERLVEE